jgi:hypothetical protein
MKYTLAIFLLSFTVACAQKESTPVDPIMSPYDPSIPVLEVSMYDVPLADHTAAMEHPYDVEFKVEKTEDGQFKLVSEIKLHGGSFYTSPHCKTDFKGIFRVEVAPNDDLSIGDDFVESPRSVEVIDQHRFINGPVNWVTVDTQYEHPLILNTKEDFTIGGKIIFVIEPKCTLETIGVLYEYKNGVLTVKPMKC